MSWTVDKVMTRRVVLVRPSTPYSELVALMNEHAIGALPVVDVVGSADRLVGMVSETDLLAANGRASARAAPAKARAEDLMTSPIVSIRPGDTVVRAARVMRRAGVRHLPVVDAAGTLVGVVSRGDLLKPYLRSDESIRHEIETELLGNLMGLPPDAVEVSVTDGVVTFRGELEESADVDLVVRFAYAVAGVVGVRNHLDYRVDLIEPGPLPLPEVRGLPAAEWRR